MRPPRGFIPPSGPAPGEAILSATEAANSSAKKIPIGKTIYIGKEMTPAKVIAVLKESFAKSHLDPQVLLHRAPDPNAGSANWYFLSAIQLYQTQTAGLHRRPQRLARPGPRKDRLSRQRNH